ncbi:MAG: hypothetical protein ACYC6N_15320 [Pirellulaceae bacterium]
MESTVFARHHHVIYERGLALVGLGPEALEERTYWLEETAAVHDEWLVERRTALLVDQENFPEAMDLLAETHFQLIHLHYAGTRLWNACKQVQRGKHRTSDIEHRTPNSRTNIGHRTSNIQGRIAGRTSDIGHRTSKAE